MHSEKFSANRGLISRTRKAIFLSCQNSPRYASIVGEMKASLTSLRRRGFTLIELLVVLAIIAGLAAIAYPLVMSMLEKGNAQSASKAAADIVQGVERFKSDYEGKLPVKGDIEMDDDDQFILVTEPGQDGGLITILTRNESEDDDEIVSTNQDEFIKATPQEKKGDGLFKSEDGYGFYDPWGSPYYVIISDRDGGAIDPFTGKETRKACLVYSLGPDRAGIAKSMQDKPRRSSSRGDKQSKKAKAAAAKEADEEYKDSLIDNIYTWKKTKE